MTLKLQISSLESSRPYNSLILHKRWLAAVNNDEEFVRHARRWPISRQTDLTINHLVNLKIVHSAIILISSKIVKCLFKILTAIHQNCRRDHF